MIVRRVLVAECRVHIADEGHGLRSLENQSFATATWSSSQLHQRWRLGASVSGRGDSQRAARGAALHELPRSYVDPTVLEFAVRIFHTDDNDSLVSGEHLETFRRYPAARPTQTSGTIGVKLPRVSEQ